MMCGFSFCFQIRVVNAFQEPSAAPAAMPFRGRTSLASLVSVAAKLESSKSEPKVSEMKECKGEANAASPTREEPAKAASPTEKGKGETCV